LPVNDARCLTLPRCISLLALFRQSATKLRKYTWFRIYLFGYIVGYNDYGILLAFAF